MNHEQQRDRMDARWILLSAPLFAAAGAVVGVYGSATLGWMLVMWAAAALGLGLAARRTFSRLSAGAVAVIAAASAALGGGLYLLVQENWAWWLGRAIALPALMIALFRFRTPRFQSTDGGEGRWAGPG